jgi:glyoxylase-like metal-dependent hydrolase (beta-lactamase superfamily II)
MTDLTRRGVFTGAVAVSATALSALNGRSRARAAAPAAGQQAPSVYRYKVGTMEISVVSDGARTFPLSETFVLNAKKDEVNAALDKAYMPRDKMTIHFAPVVINTGNKLIVIDTGNGPGDYANTKGAVGQFVHNLGAAGIDPKAVDMVIISHFHGDHVNGLLTADNQPTFPNAEVLVPTVEWKFWSDDGEMSRAPAGRMADLFKNNRRIFDAGLKKKVTPYDWNKEIAPGITAVGTIGHTPGHTSYVLASGSDKVYLQSDVTNHPDLFVRNPGWHAFFDQDPQQAETTRRAVYDMVVAEKLMVQGFHYPFPGLGHIEKDGTGYRLIPAPWNPVI